MELIWLLIFLTGLIARCVQPGSILSHYSSFNIEDNSQWNSIVGYCQPYRVSSSFASSACTCSFTLCPNDIISVDNCDRTCATSTTSANNRLDLQGSATVQIIKISSQQVLKTSTTSQFSAVSSSCALSSTSRSTCNTIDNYVVTTLSSCESVSLRQSCQQNTTCTSLFRVRVSRPTTATTTGTVSWLPLSNTTAWTSISESSPGSSELTVENSARNRCDLLVSPLSSWSKSPSSSTPSLTQSSLTLIIALACVSIFLSCSMYRMYSSYMKNRRPPDVHPIGSIAPHKNTWWFFKTNIIRPLLPVSVSNTNTDAARESPPCVSVSVGTTGRQNTTDAQQTNNNQQSSAQTSPDINNNSSNASPENNNNGVPVALLIDPISAPKTPPRPRVVEQVRPYRSVILHPELGSPAIAVPVTPSAWSPFY